MTTVKQVNYTELAIELPEDDYYELLESLTEKQELIIKLRPDHHSELSNLTVETTINKITKDHEAGRVTISVGTQCKTYAIKENISTDERELAVDIFVDGFKYTRNLGDNDNEN